MRVVYRERRHEAVDDERCRVIDGRKQETQSQKRKGNIDSHE
jgi:hypothetical protein